MVEIRVTVADPTLVHTLMMRLRGLFDSSSVTYDGVRRQVCVCSEWESRAVSEVIDVVQSWMDDGDAGSAEMAVGDRRFTLVGQPVWSES